MNKANLGKREVMSSDLLAIAVVARGILLE